MTSLLKSDVLSCLHAPLVSSFLISIILYRIASKSVCSANKRGQIKKMNVFDVSSQITSDCREMTFN